MASFAEVREREQIAAAAPIARVQLEPGFARKQQGCWSAPKVRWTWESAPSEEPYYSLLAGRLCSPKAPKAKTAVRRPAQGRLR